MKDTSGGHAARDRELFEEIASEYAAKDLDPAAGLARAHRLSRTLEAVPAPLGGRVAEIGCGAGFAADYLRGRYESFLGLDYSANLITLARARHATSENVRFIEADLLEWTPEERFDLIFAIGVLHHLEDIPAALARIWNALAPGGWFAANEPQPGNPLISAGRGLRKRLDRSYSSDQEELASETLEALLREAGFREVRTVPQGVVSTPLAEVVLPLGPLGPPLARWSCAVDRWLESRLPSGLGRWSWNVVAVGRRE